MRRSQFSTCAVCGRALSRPGRYVPGIGVVGPECHRKFAALERFLEAAHPRLVDALYGGVSLEWDRLSEEERYRLHGVILALRRAGLRLEDTRDPRTRTLHLRVNGVERPRAWKATWKRDTWREWGERLRLQAEAKALAREMGVVGD